MPLPVPSPISITLNIINDIESLCSKTSEKRRRASAHKRKSTESNYWWANTEIVQIDIFRFVPPNLNFHVFIGGMRVSRYAHTCEEIQPPIRLKPVDGCFKTRHPEGTHGRLGWFFFCRLVQNRKRHLPANLILPLLILQNQCQELVEYTTLRCVRYSLFLLAAWFTYTQQSRLLGFPTSNTLSYRLPLDPSVCAYVCDCECVSF